MAKDATKDIRMYGPLLDALREAGGEAVAREMMRTVADKVLGGTSERNEELASGGNKAENEVAWARNDLREIGLSDSPVRGTWRLTPEGWQTFVHNLDEARLLRDKVREVRKIKYRALKAESLLVDADLEVVAPNDDEQAAHQPSLIDTIIALPASGFERLCQRILRESGFAEVTVTGKSGDGGIDGHGVLQINELVSFKVLFQCKRYQGSVGSSEIRDFRGAMSGRTDKGIILTTGSFTSEAQKEAVRDGVPPIELVDKEKLISLMQRLELGVRPRTVYDVDDEFFEPFRASR